MSFTIRYNFITFELSLIIDGIETVATYLFEIVRNVLNGVRGPNDNEQICDAVEGYIQNLEENGIIVDSAVEGSIILHVTSNDPIALRKFLLQFKSHDYRIRLDKIVCALQCLDQEEIDVHMVLAKETVNNLLLCIDKTAMAVESQGQVGGSNEQPIYKEPLLPQIPFIDVAIFYAEDDRNSAQTLSQNIKEIVGSEVKVALYDEAPFGSSIGHLASTGLEVIIERSTYLFMYLTKTFVEDTWCKMASDSFLMRTLEDNKWRVVPIYTKPKNQGFKTPMLLNGLVGLKMYRNDDQFKESFKQSITNTIQSRIEKQEEVLDRWIKDSVERNKDWPNEKHLLKEVIVYKCKPDGYLVQYERRNTQKVYQIGQRKRGSCVIISNTKFVGNLKERIGGKQDERGLIQLFNQLHFDVKLYTNKTAEEIRGIMNKEATNEKQKDADCFVFIVCSHGNQTGIYGIDGIAVPVDDITTSMDGDHCTALRGKPKLFFIQACRGGKPDIPLESTMAVKTVTELLSKVKIDSDIDDIDSISVGGRTIPTKSDILVACATHNGYVSIRDIRYGTWFIQAVIQIFKNEAASTDICSMLTMVHDLVARGSANLIKRGLLGVKQSSEFKSSLTKKFYFFPGVFN